MPHAQVAEPGAPRYRADIDGLRAVAVVPVVLYHYGVKPFSGGYVGVDVFFVISGFLITSLIYGEMRAGTYSVIGFYERRVRRIFPALFAVLAFSAALSFWMLFPTDLARFSESLLGTAVFASNFVFWSEAGYFDAAASLKPLLHTWSLAVEEQFYVLFPVLLYIARKARRQSLLALVVGIFAVSLGLSIWGVRKAPDSDFYLLPFRMWELMAGAVLALGEFRAPTNRIVREGLAVLGVVGIAAAVFLFTESTPFPGASALLPCLGAALLILAGTGETTAVNRLLATPPMVGVGLISYSLYLWHWPLLVFGRYNMFGPLPAWEVWLLIATSFALATLSLYLIERPFRGGRSRFSRQQVFRLGLLAMLCTLPVGFLGWLSHGLPARFDAKTRELLEADRNPLVGSACFNVPLEQLRAGRLCRTGDLAARPSFLLWGDSVNGVNQPVIGDIMRARRRGGFYSIRNTCPPLLDVVVSGSRDCKAHNSIMARVAMQPNISEVILSGHWARYAEGVVYGNNEGHDVFIADNQTVQARSVAENRGAFFRGLERTVAMLARMHKKIVIVASVPEVAWRVPEMLAHVHAVHSDFDIRPTLKEHLDRQRFTFSAFEAMHRKYGVVIVYPDRILCASGRCMVEANGRPIYRDYHHLTESGAMLLRPLLEKAL